MNILWLVIPVALLFVVAAVAAFIWAVRDGQMDDLDSPAVRVLLDEGSDGV